MNSAPRHPDRSPSMGSRAAPTVRERAGVSIAVSRTGSVAGLQPSGQDGLFAANGGLLQRAAARAILPHPCPHSWVVPLDGGGPVGFWELFGSCAPKGAGAQCTTRAVCGVGHSEGVGRAWQCPPSAVSCRRLPARRERPVFPGNPIFGVPVSLGSRGLVAV